MGTCTCGGQPGKPCNCQQSCPPNVGGALASLVACQQQLDEFRKLIQTLVGTPSGPIKGDTSGTAALPGDVGEFISGLVNGAFTAGLQTQSVSGLILQPGDWDVQASATFNAAAGGTLTLAGALFVLNPVPAGASNLYTVNDATITGLAAGTVPTADANGWAQLVSPRTRIVTATPQLLAFSLSTNIGGAGAAGTFSFLTTARRMR